MQSWTLDVRKRQPIFFFLSLASCVQWLACWHCLRQPSWIVWKRKREIKNKRCNFSDCTSVQTAAACLLDCCLPAYSNQHRLLVGNDASTALGLSFLWYSLLLCSANYLNTSLVVAGVLMHFYASRNPREVLSFTTRNVEVTVKVLTHLQ